MLQTQFSLFVLVLPFTAFVYFLLKPQAMREMKEKLIFLHILNDEFILSVIGHLDGFWHYFVCFHIFALLVIRSQALLLNTEKKNAFASMTVLSS